ncbi:hypothetical protein [Enhygromyxa salina]|nr:hypothetical protein [Enhygromyxa salina]
MAVAPWVLGADAIASALATAAGSAIVLLSRPRGPVSEGYGMWQRFIR